MTPPVALPNLACFCQGHTPYGPLPTKDLCGGETKADLFQEAGDLLLANVAQGLSSSFAKPSSGCTGISDAFMQTPLPLLYLGSHLHHHLMTVPAVSGSIPISFHTHICLSSPWMFKPFLAESITEYSSERNLGGRRNKVEWLMSLWSCLSHLYSQIHLGAWNDMYVL